MKTRHLIRQQVGVIVRAAKKINQLLDVEPVQAVRPAVSRAHLAEDDPWLQNIAQWLKNPQQNNPDHPMRSTPERIYPLEIMVHRTGFDPDDIPPEAKIRAGKILKYLGWRKRQESEGRRQVYWIPPRHESGGADIWATAIHHWLEVRKPVRFTVADVLDMLEIPAARREESDTRRIGLILPPEYVLESNSTFALRQPAAVAAAPARPQEAPAAADPWREMVLRWAEEHPGPLYAGAMLEAMGIPATEINMDSMGRVHRIMNAAGQLNRMVTRTDWQALQAQPAPLPPPASH